MLYAEYRLWCGDSGIKNIQTKVIVSKKIKKILGESYPKTVGGDSLRGYNVKKQPNLADLVVLVKGQIVVAGKVYDEGCFNTPESENSNG